MLFIDDGTWLLDVDGSLPLVGSRCLASVLYNTTNTDCNAKLSLQQLFTTNYERPILKYQKLIGDNLLRIHDNVIL